MRIVLGALLAWIVLGIVLPLLGLFVASRRSRNAVPPAPVGSDSASSEEDPRSEPPSGRTVTIREGRGRSSHRHRLYGEGTSLYGEAERLAKEAKS